LQEANKKTVHVYITKKNGKKNAEALQKAKMCKKLNAKVGVDRVRYVTVISHLSHFTVFFHRQKIFSKAKIFLTNLQVLKICMKVSGTGIQLFI
jgi:ribosomal protein L33